MTEQTVTLAITEYEPIAAVIADLSARHKGVVFDVTQPSGLAAAKAAAKDIGQYRIALEKKRTDLKAGVLERGRLIDGEAKRIAVQLAALEDPIVDQIKAEERRIEAEREAAIRAEQMRLEAEAKAKREAEEAELAAKRAELARQQAAIDAERKAREEEDRARRAALAAEEAAGRKRIEDDNRAAAALRDEADRKARAERQAEEDRINEERRKVNAEREAEEARQRKMREEAEAKAAAERRAKEEAEREVRRKEGELADARGMLDMFIQRFGHIRQFAPVVNAIKNLPALKSAKKAA